MNQYEMLLITKTDYQQDKYEELQNKITTIIQKNNGELIRNEKIGKKKLAYPIKSNSKGVFNLFVFKSEGKVNYELETMLNINENVLRYQINKITKTEKQSFKTSFLRDREGENDDENI